MSFQNISRIFGNHQKQAKIKYVLTLTLSNFILMGDIQSLFVTRELKYCIMISFFSSIFLEIVILVFYRLCEKKKIILFTLKLVFLSNYHFIYVIL